MDITVTFRLSEQHSGSYEGMVHTVRSVLAECERRGVRPENDALVVMIDADEVSARWQTAGQEEKA